MSKAIILCLASLALLGCSRLDMQDQPKYRPQRPSEFFADGRSERQPVEGAIARGALDEDTAFYEGKDAAGKDIADFPIAVDKTVIQRGQQRYDIYCAPCHGRIGNGLGMIVRRGFKQPPSYHIDRLRDAPVGHFFRCVRGRARNRCRIAAARAGSHCGCAETAVSSTMSMRQLRMAEGIYSGVICCECLSASGSDPVASG
jgi:hypothetical protein